MWMVRCVCVCANIMCMVCSVVLCACSVDDFKELRASKANSSNGVDKLKSFFRILDPIYKRAATTCLECEVDLALEYVPRR